MVEELGNVPRNEGKKTVRNPPIAAAAGGVFAGGKGRGKRENDYGNFDYIYFSIFS